MQRPSPSLDQARLRQALIAVLDRSMPACAHVEYRLVGTGAALLHGVELPAGDVDILVKEREGVDAFGAALASFKCLSAPVWLAHSRQYYGNYEVHGVEVGVSTVEVDSEADTIETFGRGPWEHFALIPCGPHTVPTVALELRLITELCRDRADRYQPLIRYMQRHGCDLELVQRGMRRLELPQALQESVLEQLRGEQAG
jgi:hypothetical protein